MHQLYFKRFHSFLIVFLYHFLFLAFLISGFTSAYIYYQKTTPTPSPTFSIIVTTYDRAYHLPRLLKYINLLTYKDFELIIINDASPDDTQKVLNDLKLQYPYLKVVNNTYNIGREEARNLGIKLAKGKYIAMTDDDDPPLYNWLDDALNIYQNNPEVVLTLPHYIKHHTNGSFHKNNPTSLRLFLDSVGFSGLTFQRSFALQHQIQFHSDYDGIEDYDFITQFLLNGGKITQTPRENILVEEHLNRRRSHSEDETNIAGKYTYIKNRLWKHYTTTLNNPDWCSLINHINHTVDYHKQFDEKAIASEVQKCQTESVFDKAP